MNAKVIKSIGDSKDIVMQSISFDKHIRFHLNKVRLGGVVQ